MNLRSRLLSCQLQYFSEPVKIPLKIRIPHLEWLWPQDLYPWWTETSWSRRPGGDIDPGSCKKVSVQQLNIRLHHSKVHVWRGSGWISTIVTRGIHKAGTTLHSSWVVVYVLMSLLSQSYLWSCQLDYVAQVDTGSSSRDWELMKNPGRTEGEGLVEDGQLWRFVWSQQLCVQSANYAQQRKAHIFIYK